jgi:DNA sulfur modification protein DndB
VSQGFGYVFPALKGVQAGQEYFAAMCPLKLLPRLFQFDGADLPPELRAQRTLNRARIPEIASYITNNRTSYAFSAITVSVDGDVRFDPAYEIDGNAAVGSLWISMTTRFVINDGQHRRAAIEAALEEEPALGDETITVVFFLDKGLERSQQLFADLNKHSVKPTKSLGVLYEHRDPVARLARDLAQRVPPFKGLTETEKTTISNRSLSLFTLSAIYQATAALLAKRAGDPVSKQEATVTERYWSAVAEVIPEWRLASTREVRSADLRRDYVHAHGVTLQALGIAGNRLLASNSNPSPSHLAALAALDWRRANRDLWEGRAMTGGHMSKARQNVRLTANLIMQVLGLELTAEERQLEAAFSGAHGTSEQNLEAT